MSTTCDRSSQPFLYHAVIYSSREELVDLLATRVRGRPDERDPVLVAVEASAEEQLRQLLGDEADAVEFVDPQALSGEPTGRVIRRFMTRSRHAGSTGPVSILVQHGDGAGSDAETWLKLECEVNATLESIPIELVYLYNVASSRLAVLDNTRSPHVPARSADAGDTPEPPPAPDLGAAYDVHWFDHLDSRSLRGWLYFHSATAGLSEAAADEFVLAVHEAATTASSVAHDSALTSRFAPGPDHHRVPVRIWPWSDQVTCEVPVSAPLPGIATEQAPADSALCALWTTERTCTRVRIGVHRGPTSGSRIRVSVIAPSRIREPECSHPGTNRTSEVRIALPKQGSDTRKG